MYQLPKRFELAKITDGLFLVLLANVVQAALHRHSFRYAYTKFFAESNLVCAVGAGWSHVQLRNNTDQNFVI